MNNKNKYIYTTLHKHIKVMLYLSLLPGLGYIMLGWLHGVLIPGLFWYTLLSFCSFWGYKLYNNFNYEILGESELAAWYSRVSYFFYGMFSLWTLIFMLYANETESNMHYIAIFTQLGSLVVASALLFADKHILRPILLILTLPLTFYFLFIGEFYGYVLALFSLIFSWVLSYSAKSSFLLLERINHQATHDQLTGLYNRHAFLDLLQRTVNDIQSTKEFAYIILIDLDRFKVVNDTLGHHIGDALLQEVTTRTLKITSQNQHSITARIGGDEFVYLSGKFTERSDALKEANTQAKELLESLREPYLLGSQVAHISASIGISLLDENALEVSEYIKEADAAMYEVKSHGRDGAILYNAQLSKKINERVLIEQHLKFAIEKKEIYLNFQPQFNLSKKIIGCEVLVRWKSEALGFVPPDKFILIAEQSGSIVKLGNYILEESLKTLIEWYLKGIRLEQFSINISSRQLFDPSFVEDTIMLCKRHLDEQLLSTLVFEITETHLIEDLSRVVGIINELKQHLGVKFSIDDFGTGYSSLGYLQKLPIDEIKIDKSFIDALSDKHRDQHMINIMFSIAEVFQLKLVAEGVETQEQFSFLKARNCDALQGYLLSRPLEKDAFERLYESDKKS